MGNMIKNSYKMPKTRLDYTRSVHKYLRTHTTNMLTGLIYPLGFINMMPGDTAPKKFGLILQSAPLLGPSFDNIYIDIISVWCPTRLVMRQHNEWLGDNDSFAWTLNQNIALPRITKMRCGVDQYGNKMSKSYYAEHYRAPHFGLRYFDDTTTSANSYYTLFNSITGSNSRYYSGIQVIPFRMYDIIYNKLFRNQNITNPVLFSTQTGTDLGVDISQYGTGGGKLYHACRLKNMFTTARLSPAIESVDVLAGIKAPVDVGAAHATSVGEHLTFNLSNGNAYGSGDRNLAVINNFLGSTTSASSSDLNNYIVPNNLYAQLAGLTVNSLYYSIMLQRYFNKASTGRRPVEFYSEFFGIQSSEVGHDDPQLLSQKRFKVDISRVPATANSTDIQGHTQPIGSQGAFSVTGQGGILFPDFTATEYGMIMVFGVIRTQESFASGIDRYLSDSDLLSTYLPCFDHIGDIDVEGREFTDITYTNNNYIFGYQSAWYWYRHFINDVVGICSPGEPLDYFTLARDWTFGGSGAFGVNDDFILQYPHEFDRMLQFPVLYNPSGVACDIDGEPYQSVRYQWIIQFAVEGDFARTMSKDSEQLLF